MVLASIVAPFVLTRSRVATMPLAPPPAADKKPRIVVMDFEGRQLNTSADSAVPKVCFFSWWC